MAFDFKNMICFGVAGNFAGHLEQAGEAADFISVQTEEEIQPKAIFLFMYRVKHSILNINFLPRFL